MNISSNTTRYLTYFIAVLAGLGGTFRIGLALLVDTASKMDYYVERPLYVAGTFFFLALIFGFFSREKEVLLGLLLTSTAIILLILSALGRLNIVYLIHLIASVGPAMLGTFLGRYLRSRIRKSSGVQ